MFFSPKYMSMVSKTAMKAIYYQAYKIKRKSCYSHYRHDDGFLKLFTNCNSWSKVILRFVKLFIKSVLKLHKSKIHNMNLIRYLNYDNIK